MAEPGIVRTKAGWENELPDAWQFADPKANWFRDGREGTDRWGRERRKLKACGTGFGDDQYVCPAYLEEACAGNFNVGDRVVPDERAVCELNCGECGSWGDKLTIAYCGWKRGQPMWDAALAEVRDMNGTIRLDEVTVRPHEALGGFPAIYGPSIEAYCKEWMKPLAATMPLACTTMKTAGRSVHRTKQLLRERLGGFEGYLLVNGLTKDDLIDDVWDDRKAVIDFCKRSGVDAMMTPEYSYYASRQPCMLLYNAHRIFRFYEECMEVGFDKVILDIPAGHHADWYMQEIADFIVRNEVKYVSLSYQQFKERGGAGMQVLWNAKFWQEHLPDDVHILLFGLGSPIKVATVTKLLEGRPLTFFSVEPAARSLFFEFIYPAGAKAPAGMDKTEVFRRNYEVAFRTTERAHSAASRPRGKKVVA